MRNKLAISICILCVAVFMAGCDIFDWDDDGNIGRKDNCPFAANPDQRDYDGDGMGDACDMDRDGDGIKDDTDPCISLDTGGYGQCEMLLGVAFDGKSCVYTSGCTCGPDCDLIFPDFESCEQACDISRPAGKLLTHTDCKPPASGESNSALGPEQPNIPSGEECIEFDYENGSLSLKHINAAFNCCPGEIVAQIKIDDKKIAIAEDSVEDACNCLCLYDLTYEISDLVPDTYTIEIIGDSTIRLQVDLATIPSSTFCEDRMGYPWQ